MVQDFVHPQYHMFFFSVGEGVEGQSQSRRVHAGKVQTALAGQARA